MSLTEILSKIQELLKNREEVRVEVQDVARKTVRLSKQAILFMHQQRFGDAEKALNEADKNFTKLGSLAKNNPDVFYTGLVEAAFEEYSEARVLLSLLTENRFISPEEIGVPALNYVLALGDIIGELRRRTLDNIRRGDIKTSEESLKKMEQIYLELTAMDDVYMLVPGLRRKCDVARRIIETTRGDVTIEARRSSLERSIKKLESTIKGNKKSKPK
jgi:translin